MVVPPARPGDRPDPETMPVALAMRAFAPGRASRRFVGTTIGPPGWGWRGDPGPRLDEIDIDEHYRVDALGDWLVRDGNIVAAWPVLRILGIRPLHPPKRVRDTSNARLVWRTQMVHARRGLFQRPPAGTNWQTLIVGIEAFLHGEQTPVEARRFAGVSQADVQLEGQDFGPGPVCLPPERRPGRARFFPVRGRSADPGGAAARPLGAAVRGGGPDVASAPNRPLLRSRLVRREACRRRSIFSLGNPAKLTLPALASMP